jgi:uncharacterized protein involved in response to NO
VNLSKSVCYINFRLVFLCPIRSGDCFDYFKTIMKFFLERWHVLASAPHRLFFLGGACQGIAAIIWWALELWQRFRGSEPLFAWTIPALWAHAYFMIYGFFPFFIFGFLFTFFPNWLDAEPIRFRGYMASFIAMSLGATLFYFGLVFSKPLLFFALLTLFAGWGTGTLALVKMLLPARSAEKLHLVLITLFVSIGALGLFSFILWLYLNIPVLIRVSLTAGIWCFLLPLVVTVSHLVIPFFSRVVIKNYQIVRPLPILWILLLAIVFRGLLEGTALSVWFWIPDVVMIVNATYLTLVWRIQKSFANKMLFMLHLSFVWFSIGTGLDLIQSLTFLLSQGSSSILGHAPLHALTLGFFASMVVGISTRVTFGHSGREVRPERTSWNLFLIFQGAAVLRVFGDFFPAGSLANRAGFEGSALLWIVGFSLWIMNFGYLLWQPSTNQHS